ncbi:carboxypeptidase-like regulatory domain-containing protein [Algoriphagus sp. PAP.12]|uniref:carboxypeptidase-like regulatory domain-containing protein n=1 Tax=Algoriphagus sp. PAP.12 TaxID=2996678 RepID=UPI00227A9C7F|nr:carboxypeptidase-like regulatory domain-containing protein [Algoriphagus sp. PAP.12]
MRFFSNNFQKRIFGILFLAFTTTLYAFSQSASVKGIVKDSETGETLPFCNVFINNTTISTVTDMDGAYILEGLEPGAIELSFSFMGYEAQTKPITLNPGGTLTVNLSMKALETELSDVEIKAKRDKTWERDLRKFENLFLGNDAVAGQSQIENPWVIDFPEAEEKGSFKAEALLPIEIMNNYLGYKITFDLKEFFDNPTSYRIAGAARFEEMTPESENQRTAWEQNRADTYRKSPQNMFRALLTGEHQKEGFYLYGDKAGGSPSMNMRSDIFANELGRSVVEYKPDNLVTKADKPGEYLINMKGRIEIHYQKGYTQVNTYKDAPYPVSWLEVNGGKVRVKENGSVLNPQDLVFSGDMDRKRISTLLPLDYDAEKAIQLQSLERTAQNLQEKVFIHTDKPVYYAGDEVYFKAFINYGNPYLKEELSKVLYVELINENRDYIIEKKFKIFNGGVSGNFHLPDSLSEEKYFLRAYTNWNRNYGPDYLFMQPLEVLDLYSRVSPGTASEVQNPNFSVKPNQDQYGKREKVTLTLSAKDQSQMGIQAILAVSIIDQTQIPMVPYPVNITDQLKLEKIPETVNLDRFSYQIEKGLTKKGKVTDEKGKGEEGEITVFVNDFEGMIDLESDKNGEFAMEDMEFYGPMKLAIQAMDKKGKPIENVELVEDLKAPVVLPLNPIFPQTTKADEAIRPLQLIEPISANEEAEDGTKEKKSSQAIYGDPDYIVTGDKLMGTGNTVDLVNSLAGNVPGMRVIIAGTSGQQQIRIRGGGSSASGSFEPVVMVNGAVRPSVGSITAADNLRTIDPRDIDRVEVVSRIVSTLGEQGKNGVIAVYLKEGGNGSGPLGTKGMSMFTIEGYQPPQSFYQVDYEQEEESMAKDIRQTLYWNPMLVTDESGNASITFFTNDNAGPMTVEIRGLSINGAPISGTFTINQK